MLILGVATLACANMVHRPKKSHQSGASVKIAPIWCEGRTNLVHRARSPHQSGASPLEAVRAGSTAVDAAIILDYPTASVSVYASAHVCIGLHRSASVSASMYPRLCIHIRLRVYRLTSVSAFIFIGAHLHLCIYICIFIDKLTFVSTILDKNRLQSRSIGYPYGHRSILRHSIIL